MGITRASIAYLDKLISGSTVSRLLLTSPNWTRTIERMDLNGNVIQGKLLEFTAENLNTHSDEIDNAAWTKTRCSITDTSKTVDPYGETTVNDVWHEDNSADPPRSHWKGDTGIPVTAATYYCNSGMYKEINRNWVILEPRGASGNNSYHNLATGDMGPVSGPDVIESGSMPMGNGWWLCYNVWLQPGTGTQGVYMLLATGSDHPDSATFNGLDQDSVYSKGHQTEIGKFPTSRIRTSGGTAARSADSSLDLELGSSLSSAKGSFQFKILVPAHTPDSTVDIFELSEDASNYLKVQINTSGQFIVTTAKSGGNAGSVTINKNVCGFEIHELKVSFEDNRLKASVFDINTGTRYDGSTDTSCDIPTGMTGSILHPSGFVVGNLSIWDDVNYGQVVPQPYNSDFTINYYQHLPNEVSSSAAVREVPFCLSKRALFGLRTKTDYLTKKGNK